MDNYENMLGLMAEKQGTLIDKVPVEQKATDEILERRRRRRGRDAGAAEEGGAEEVKLGPSEKIEVTVFNRDIMAYGVEHELTYNKAREKRVKFVRYTTDHLPKAFMEGNQLMLTYFHETLKLERTMPVDMVVLATPLINQPDAGDLSKMLKVPLGQEGFFLEAHVKLRPVDFATDGIYVRRHVPRARRHNGVRLPGRSGGVEGRDPDGQGVCPGRGAVIRGRREQVHRVRHLHAGVPVRRAQKERQGLRRGHSRRVQGLRLLRRDLPRERDHDDQLHGRAAAG